MKISVKHIILLILLFIALYVAYNYKQNIDSYNAWFYSNSITLYNKDYHIDNELVPLHDDIYLGELQVGNDVYYVVNKRIGSNHVQELIERKGTMLHISDKSYIAHEYLDYEDRTTKKPSLVIAVPNEKTQKNDIKVITCIIV